MATVKKYVKHTATRCLIRKDCWKKTSSKIPSQQINDPQGLLKEKYLRYPATRLLIRKDHRKKTNSKIPTHQIIDPQGLLKENMF